MLLFQYKTYSATQSCYFDSWMLHMTLSSSSGKVPLNISNCHRRESNPCHLNNIINNEFTLSLENN